VNLRVKKRLGVMPGCFLLPLAFALFALCFYVTPKKNRCGLSIRIGNTPSRKAQGETLSRSNGAQCESRGTGAPLDPTRKSRSAP
jgi:hypothetical protein